MTTPATPAPVLLCDVEGTTTAISFVTDVLFPESVAQVDAFLAARGAEAAVRDICALIMADATPAEAAAHAGHTLVAAVVRRQVAADVKAKGLKALQGLIWEDAYRSGRVKGHVFDDVPRAFAAAVQAGRRVAIYSSGSVLAQELLFGHSSAGNLRPLISAHFDTAVGPKREAASYVQIAQRLHVSPAEIMFCTDIPAEATAALAAGCQATLLMRAGNAPLAAGQPCPVHGDLLRV